MGEGAPNFVDLNKKHTLHQLYPKRTGWISFLFLLGNAGLQVYSHVGLSAVIKSSIDTSGNKTVEGEDACVNDAVFMEYWINGTGQLDYGENQYLCGFSLVTGGYESFAQCMIGRGFEGNEECLACFSVPIECTSENCLQPCFPDRTVQACLDCREEAKCDDAFYQCSGVKTPKESVANQTFGQRRRLEEDVPEMNVVYEISFISSVQDAIRGGAWAIALVIVVFSGIWPYTKNVIMFISWFVPMTASTRSAVLKNLTRLAKWSLVDVFAIVIILAGVRIDKTLDSGERLIVVAESRIAIYTFCVAAIWDLVQGEWMRLMHLEALQKYQQDDSDVPKVNLEDGLNRDSMIKVADFQRANEPREVQTCSAPGKIFLGLFMIVQICIAITSMSIYCISFRLSGLVAEFNGTNLYEYSAGSIATSLTSPEALAVNDSIPGTIFLMLVYLFCSIIIPLFEYSSILISTYAPWNAFCCGNPRRFRTYCMAVDIVGGFACQDVFFLSFLVVIAEWDKLIDSAVASQADNVKACAGNNGLCIGMTADIQPGLYVMIPAVLMGWVMELFFTYEYAQIFHPVEQVQAAKSFFGWIVPSTFCGAPAELKHGEAMEKSVQLSEVRNHDDTTSDAMVENGHKPSIDALNIH